MQLQVIYTAKEIGKYKYIEAFLRLSGFMVYDHILEGESVKTPDIPVCITIMGESETENNLLKTVSPKKTLIWETGIDNDIFIEKLIGCLGNTYNGKTEIELRQLVELFTAEQFYNFYSVSTDDESEQALRQYINFHRILKEKTIDFEKQHGYGSHLRHAILITEYHICALCDRFGYVRPFSIDDILKSTESLRTNDLLKESVYYICGQLCELDKFKRVYAYEYYRKSLVMSLTKESDREFWQALNLTVEGMVHIKPEFTNAHIKNGMYASQLYGHIPIPNNYLAAYGMGNSCFKYNNSEKAALFFYTLVTLSNNTYYEAYCKEAACIYNIESQAKALKLFKRAYAMLKKRVEANTEQCKEVDYLLKIAKSIDKLSGNTAHNSLYETTLKTLKVAQTQ